MPGRDGTGPYGRGAATGRGLGSCTGAYAGRHAVGAGLGFACGCGRRGGRGIPAEEGSPEVQKQALKLQKAVLEDRLNDIDKRLDTL
jgi:hypothetical protein